MTRCLLVLRSQRPAAAQPWLPLALVASCMAGLGFLAGGCVSHARLPSVLPARNTLTVDQLVVYSDFSLPRQHRLMDELRQLRGELLAKLALPPSDEPIHVYLFETDDHYRTFLHDHHPDFPNRRAFFLETDTRLAVYAQWGDRVAEDLRHEVTHGYLHSVVRDVPLWLDEGIAEFFETPRHAGGVHVDHVALLTSQFVAGLWQPGLQRLEQLDEASNLTQIDYAESWAWVHWLLETDSQRRALIHEYLQTLKRSQTPEPLSTALSRGSMPAERALVEHLFALLPRTGGERGPPTGGHP